VTAKLASGLLVAALCRSAAQAGGSAAVLSRGDADAGAILLIAADRGRVTSLNERVLSPDGCYRWSRIAVADDDTLRAELIERRRSRDPDLWVIELDVPDAERFAADHSGDN